MNVGMDGNEKILFSALKRLHFGGNFLPVEKNDKYEVEKICIRVLCYFCFCSIVFVVFVVTFTEQDNPNDHLKNVHQ